MAEEASAFMEGLRLAVQFMREAKEHENNGLSFIRASDREGAPQAPVFERMLAVLPTEAAARAGFVAVMSEAIASGCDSFGDEEHFLRLSFEDIHSVHPPVDVPPPALSNVVAFERRAMP